MRTINQTTAFKRDLKRESKGQYRANLSGNFVAVVQTLANDQPLAERFHASCIIEQLARLPRLPHQARLGAYLPKAR
jgi:mRNA-degrading endonuclease YafQ of YafQ-DinJ toxin-antitoxin module